MPSLLVFLPDGKSLELPKGATALDLAHQISPKLASVVVCARVNGEIKDLQDPLTGQAQVTLLKADSPEGLDAIRHSCEHVLAAAVCKLFEGAQVTMGPKTHEGEFYYDFDIGRPFTPEDLEKIEAEMKTLIASGVSFHKKWVNKAEARQMFLKLGQRYKPEILDWIPSETVSLYQNGDFIDLCRGPHVPHAGHIKAFKLLSVSGCYWRGDSHNEMLQRISGIAFASQKELDQYLFQIEEAKKRDHRKLGTKHDLFFVSNRFDSHSYAQNRPIEVQITGSFSKHLPLKTQGEITAWLSEKVMGPLATLFAPMEVHTQGYAITSHDEAEKWFDVQVQIMAAALSQELKQNLKTLEASLQHAYPKGQLAFVIESKFTEELGPGLVMWLPKGARVRSLMEDHLKKMHFDGGYELVYSPHIAKSDLWKVSGHWDFYKDSMFSPMMVDGQEYVLKPMNCPFHILSFKNKLRSYRDLPLKIFEFGTVYRYELAGVMHGLMRVRGFTQDDAHLFCRWDHIETQIDEVIGFVLKVLNTFGFHHFEVNLSTRPKEFVGEIAQWEKAQEALLMAVKRHSLPYAVDEGGGAFYGPKIDIKLKDSLGRLWQCSTVQLDFNLPNRFGLSFINQKGEKEQPVMIHRALLGSLERFMGILIEEHKGAFPFWLSPEQIRILPISEKHLDYAYELEKNLKPHYRVGISQSNEKLGAKIREAQLDQIPVMLIVGDQDMEKGGASVRLKSEGDQGFMTQEALKTWLAQL